MTPERWQHVKAIFNQALELDEAKRPAYIDQACDDDAELRTEVTRLLHQHAQADDFLESPANLSSLEDADTFIPDEDAQIALPPGQRVGSYTILGVLGSGGMAIVYRAEQDKPRRTVALKVIKPGFASGRMLRRFEQEAQVLGRLHHSGIAQIYELGTADTGHGLQPFFAMELIEGQTLTKYAQRKELGTRQRLQLLARICDAVEHAHRHGIIHRDLKPGNILLDETGRPKVLDFGVARATDSDIQATTMKTDVGQLIGTIPYMSPEQVSGDPAELDTRSDVYALGVIGYELLTGRLPYNVLRTSIPDAVRTIREDEASPLSFVSKVFRGDLDTIFAKALEKDKTRRYQSAANLAADIRRYLDDKPIVARRPSTWYQLRKFATRNKALVAGCAVASLVFVVACVVVTWQLSRTVTAERMARHTVTALSQAIAGIDPDVAKHADLTALRRMLDAHAQNVETDFPDQPEVEALLRNTIGDGYAKLGVYDEAQRHLQAALDIRREFLGPNHPDVAESLNAMAGLLLETGDYKEAERLSRQALEMRRTLFGENHPAVADSLNSLARSLKSQGRYLEAEPFYRQSLGIRRSQDEPDRKKIASGLNDLAQLYRSLRDDAKAETMYRQALEIRRTLHGKLHTEVATSMANLGSFLSDLGEYEEAERLLRNALDIRRKLLGTHHATVVSMNKLALLLREKGEYDEAEELFREALELRPALLGARHPHVGVSMHNLALVLHDKGDYEAAEKLFNDALVLWREALPEKHVYIAAGLHNLAKLLYDVQRYDEAEEACRRALAIRTSILSADHPDTAESRYLMDRIKKRG